MSEPGTNPEGISASLRRIADSLLGLAQTRIQLFAVELETESLRRLDLLLRLGLALTLGVIGLMVGTAALAIYLWQMAGYAGLLLVAGLLVALAVLLVWRLRESVRKAPLPLATTAAEFEKDRACLRGQD